MRTDRELLELAAKAAGIEITWEHGQDYPERIEKFRGHLENYEPWDPLTDDGDALRLAVKLNISINRPVEGDSVPHWGTYADDHTQKIQVKERDNGNPEAATRRAIVLAAAEVGDSMP